jgi:catalase
MAPGDSFTTSQSIPETAKGAVPRGQHPKLLGLLEAKLIVGDDLPTEMRVGIFKEPGKSYDCWIRYSNARNLDDRDPGGHGMAIKLRNVTTGTESSNPTQDFVLFDSPVFFVGDPMQYVEFEEATLRAYGKSKLGTKLTVLLNYYWRHLKQLQNLNKAQRRDVIDPLAVRYWSVTPYQLGTAAVKYSAHPVGEGAAPAVVERSKDMLREAMKVHLSRTDVSFVAFEFQVQVQSDTRSMPIEDPTKVWDEAISRPVTVARLRIPTRQPFDTKERDLIAEDLAFNPWHTLPEHAPLGGINRVRRAVYESLSEFRHALNHVPRQELDVPAQAK